MNPVRLFETNRKHDIDVLTHDSSNFKPTHGVENYAQQLTVLSQILRPWK